MALSNILKEPRRELIETSFGVGVIAGYGLATYFVANCLYSNIPSSGDPSVHIPYILCLFFGGILVALANFLLFLIHSIGELVCNAMQKNGYDPRPRQRY